MRWRHAPAPVWLHYPSIDAEVPIPMPSLLAQIADSKVWALTVTTATRWSALPNVPSLGEFVPGYQASGWYGIGAPRSTPAEIIEKLNREISFALADPDMKARLVAARG